MNTNKIKWVVAGLIGILALVVFCTGFTFQSLAIEALDPEIAQDILNNTVQIRLFAPLPVNDQVNPANQNYVMAQGLGSLVAWHGATVIVTHNHWGEMLAGAEYAQVLDAQGKLIVKLGMDEFNDLTLYGDPGTLVLAAPAGFSATITVDETATVSAGDIVTLVHQSAEDPDRLDLLQAQVVRNKIYKGQVVYQLSLAGEGQIIPGDSGGGIWLNGKLVGNMWASYLDGFKLPFTAETSLAAPLPHFQISSSADPQIATLFEPSYNGPSDLAIAK